MVSELGMDGKYLKRVADQVLVRKLEASGAVLIEGPKWCGKTRTAREQASSALLMQDPDYTQSYLQAADTKPSLLLRGATPRLIDEWQLAPVLWDAVRHAVDERSTKGQFILTGSAVPSDEASRHTGTGRIARMKMRPMSLYESLESSGDVSLRNIFDGSHDIDGVSPLSVERLAFALARGGWPSSISDIDEAALRQVYNYVEAVINVDVSRVDGVEKSPTRVRALLRSLARSISTTASMSTIRADMAGDEGSLSEKSISSYLNALRRIYVVEDLPAWTPVLRSKTVIRTSPKRHFVDPSIAAAALYASPSELLEDFRTFGFLFESMCVRDLRVYTQAIGGEVFHYQDKRGLEVDTVVHLHDGRWGGIEVKMGQVEADKAADNLRELKDSIDLDKMSGPSFLMVLTAGQLAYRRSDGVLMVPIGCLKD